MKLANVTSHPTSEITRAADLMWNNYGPLSKVIRTCVWTVRCRLDKVFERPRRRLCPRKLCLQFASGLAVAVSRLNYGVRFNLFDCSDGDSVEVAVHYTVGQKLNHLLVDAATSLE